MAKFHVGQHVLLATLGAPVECTVIRVKPVSRMTGRQIYGLRSKAGYCVAAAEIELTAAPEPAPEPEYKFEIGDYALVNETNPRFHDSLVRIVGRKAIALSSGAGKHLLYRVEVIEGEMPLYPHLPATFPESALDVAA